MAFCPHCGKQVADQASKCISCGQEIEPKAKAARFKGTMMMTPPTVATPQSPAASTPEPAKAAPAPTPVAAAPPAAAPVRGPTPAPSKVMKATMLGTGGAGLAPPAGMKPVTSPGVDAMRAPAPAAAAPAPAASAASAWNQPPKPAAAPPPAAAAPIAQPAPPIETEPPSAPAAPAAASPYTPSAAREDSQRFQRANQMPQRGSSDDGYGRESTEGVVPVLPTGRLLAIGIGGIVVISAIGYLAARMLGLIN